MRLGDVYYWESDQVIGYDRRNKYHIYIGDGDWRHQGNVFLFINKSNAHGGYKISNPPYTFLKYPESYISCAGIACYADDVVAKKIGALKGQIQIRHLRELRAAVAASEVMERHAIRLVCDHIDRGTR